LVSVIIAITIYYTPLGIWYLSHHKVCNPFRQNIVW